MNNKVWMARLLGSVLLLGLAQSGQAETIYKYRDPNGVIVYSSTKPVNTPILGEMDSKSLAADEKTTYSSQAAAGAGASAGVAEADAHVRRLNEASERVARAEQNLKSAQDALAQGKEPQAGERTGTASGYTRLNDSYQERVAALEKAVQQARQELDEAYRARTDAK